jgi:16S rRNA (cytosine967-C5)-methyltransferase
MTLRVDTRQTSRADYAAALAAAGMTSRPHPTIATALVLDRAVAVERLPGFDAGRVSVQDAGAQMAAGLLDARPGQRVLDACAAPGGKTLALLQHTGGLRLTALDVDADRLQRVEQNLARAGLSAELIAADAADPAGAAWAAEPFDRILVDAPCSATGVMSRPPDIRLLRRAEDIDALASRQAALLDALWSVLAPGGRMLYVTCSILPRENADQVDAFVARRPDARVVELPTTAGTVSGKGVQLLPGVDLTDGFYYAALEKAAAGST